MLSVARRWALAPAAILTRYNLDDPQLLGGLPESEAAARESRELIAESWDIVDAASARESLAFLVERGNRHDFDALRASGAGTKKQKRFFGSHAAELGDRGLLAWDLGRVPFVAGKAFLAGFLDEGAAWEVCLGSARVLQAKLPSWEAFGREYLLGRHYWSGEPDPSMHHVYRALVLERDGPWAIPWDTPLT